MRVHGQLVTLIDVVKKLLLKFDNIKGLEDLYIVICSMFMADAKHNGINNYFTLLKYYMDTYD